MIRLGMLDFDTSHVSEFTKRMNHLKLAKDQWVEGARVVIACPGESKIMPERIAILRKEMEAMEIPLVEKPTDMIGKVDGMLIESQEGGVHFERARPFLEAGIPCYIDKPFTCSVADARKIVELANKKGVPVFSSSSLRYAPEVVEFMSEPGRAPIHGVLTYAPAPLNEADPKRNPGLFHYGIHGVEMLYTLMGPGCQRVTCTHEKDVDVVTGTWRDGRVATMRGLRSGPSSYSYGFVAFTSKGVRSVTVGTKLIYRELCKKVVEFFQTKKSPVDPAVTVEIIAFIEAANRSAANHGAGETLGE
jgi:virulence factor